jgi:catechol 2,3-dioxygenase
MTEPCFDVAHLGNVEVYTDKFEESLDFFTRIYGLVESGRNGDSAYLHAFDDCEFHTLKLTRQYTTGVGHIGYRASSPEALERHVAAIEQAGIGIGWDDGDLGRGSAYRFKDPFNHVFEIHCNTNLYVPTEATKPALKNITSAYPGVGVCPHRLDHLNLLPSDGTVFRAFMQPCLGSRVTEQIQLDNGRLGAGSR